MHAESEQAFKKARLSPEELLAQWPTSYGAAGRSSAARMRERDEVAGLGRTKRPDHQAYTESLLAKGVVEDVANSEHARILV